MYILRLRENWGGGGEGQGVLFERDRGPGSLILDLVFSPCLAGHIGSQVLRDGGRFPGVNKKVNLVERVLAGSCRVLAVHGRCVQIAAVVKMVEV